MYEIRCGREDNNSRGLFRGIIDILSQVQESDSKPLPSIDGPCRRYAGKALPLISRYHRERAIKIFGRCLVGMARNRSTGFDGPLKFLFDRGVDCATSLVYTRSRVGF